MLVSVIIPAFNAEEFLTDTIDSVLRQTYDNLEIIVVDDGSTDNTVQIAEKALGNGRYPYTILRQPNQGAAVARNIGWKHATGQWIQFLDADDLLHPNKIQSQIASADQHAVDVIYSDWQRLIKADGKWVADTNVRVPVIGSDSLACVLEDTNFIQLGSQLFKLAVLERVGGFDQSHTPVEDVGLLVKIAIADGVFFKCAAKGPVSWYRDRPGSLSKLSHRKFIEAVIMNAKLAERHVRAGPKFSQRTRDAIVESYYFGARYFAERDWNRFEEIVKDIEGLQPIFVPTNPRRLKILSQLVGYRKAEHLSVLFRRGKSKVRLLTVGSDK